MNVMTATSQTAIDFQQLKTRLKATWMAGDYDTFARYMEKDANWFFRRLGVAPGTRLLDVGCGAGQLALIAAKAGARVTGCDISTNWLEKARARAAAEGLNVAFDEGDAEALPYAIAQFDAVVSLIGAMFAPRPERVAAELLRVCRPGGTIALVNHFRSPSPTLARLAHLIDPVTRWLGWTTLRLGDVLDRQALQVERQWKTSRRSLFTIVLARNAKPVEKRVAFARAAGDAHLSL